jgi:small neutral amino acid transporter SnatA (MarC family)
MRSRGAVLNDALTASVTLLVVVDQVGIAPVFLSVMSKPRVDPTFGISSVDVLILTERHPACRRRESRQALVRNVRT